jgi:hypothetical protein
MFRQGVGLEQAVKRSPPPAHAVHRTAGEPEGQGRGAEGCKIEALGKPEVDSSHVRDAGRTPFLIESSDRAID